MLIINFLKNSFPRFFLFVLALIASSQVVAKQKPATINGKIVDENQESVAYVTVAIKNTNIGTFSDAEGQFELKYEKFGDQTLVFSYLGYETKQIAVHLAPDKVVELDVVLKARSIDANEIIVSAKRKNTEIEQQGFAATSIEVKEIQVENIELNQVLDQNAGIHVRRQGGFGSRTDYSVNGLGGKAVRFFLDGVPMDYFGSSFSVNTIPISFINRVDIYKGVVPVELGNDALGGAVNLVSKESLNNQLDLSYSYGSFNTHQASLNGYWHESSSGFTSKLFAFYNYSNNDYEVWGDDISYTDLETYRVVDGYTATRFHDAYESKAVKADVGFTQKTWADQLFLGIVLTKLDKEIQHGATMQVAFGEATYDQNMVMPYLQYQDESFLHDKLSLNFFASYSHLNRNRVDTTRNRYDWRGIIISDNDDQGEQTYTLNALTEKAVISRININYRINELHKLGYNQIFSNLERTESDPAITNSTEGYFAPQYYTKHALGLTLQSNWLNDKLNTTIFTKWFAYNAEVNLRDYEGGKHASFKADPSNNIPGFGIAASYRLFPRLLISGAIEKAVRLPEYDEILGDGLNVMPDTSLNPEKSMNINVGVTFDIVKSQTNSLNLYCNFFYRDVHDKIQKVLIPDGEDLLVYDNFSHVTMSGFDGRLKYDYKGIFSFVQSISYLEPIIRTDINNLGISMTVENPKLPNTPFFQANSEVRVNFLPFRNKNIHTSIYWRFAYVGEFLESIAEYGNEEDRKDVIPLQNAHSTGIAVSLPKEHLALSFDIKNIFNAQLFDNYAVQKPGRAFYVKLSYQLK